MLYAEARVQPDGATVPEDEPDVALLRTTALEYMTTVGMTLESKKTSKLRLLITTAPPGRVADLVAGIVGASFDERFAILAQFDVPARVRASLELVSRQNEIVRVTKKIASKVQGDLSKRQRELYLRQQLDAIRSELGDTTEDEVDELQELQSKISRAQFSKEAQVVVNREFKRLKKMQPMQAEYQVVRTYIDWLCEMPWNEETTDRFDLAACRKQLDDDHFGLEPIKKRITEFLAVQKMRNSVKGPILCFVGPPGVGKTSLGRSIAQSVGRTFHRISLGGVRDEAEIRGHRRTYVGAMPGSIIHGMKKAGARNPVFLFDEIDKLGMPNLHGDPASAMLEVLDPEQNAAFTDHYLAVPFDLSHVMFIATANTLDTIPHALLDRMEVVSISGYTIEEKVEIARRHLVPKQSHAHGIPADQELVFDADALATIATAYTRESGVRDLERKIAAVCRGKTVEFVEAGETGVSNRVASGDLEKYLGVG